MMKEDKLTSRPVPPPFPTPITFAESPGYTPRYVFDRKEDYYSSLQAKP